MEEDRANIDRGDVNARSNDSAFDVVPLGSSAAAKCLSVDDCVLDSERHCSSIDEGRVRRVDSIGRAVRECTIELIRHVQIPRSKPVASGTHLINTWSSSPTSMLPSMTYTRPSGNSTRLPT